jgi:hypothetical protein
LPLPEAREYEFYSHFNPAKRCARFQLHRSGLEREDIDLNVYVVTSCELFDLQPSAERDRIFPEAHQLEAMGITDFTLATMTRWLRSNYGRAHSLHPFRHGHFLGSGSGAMVMAEAGLDGDSQFEAVRAYVRGR